MPDSTPLRQRAQLTVERCERLSSRISKEASKIENREHALRVINIVVGAVAALVTLSGPLSSALGVNTSQAISVIASVVLVLDGLIPYFRRGPSADRLKDYAFYIHGYAGSIGNTLADTGLTDAQRRSRVLEHVEKVGLADAG